MTAVRKTEFGKPDGAVFSFMGIVIPIIVSFIATVVIMIISVIAGKTVTEIQSLPGISFLLTVFVEIAFLVGLILYSRACKINFVQAAYLKEKPKYINIAFVTVLAVGFLFLLNPLIGLWENLLELIGYNIITDDTIPLNNAGQFILALVCVAVVPAFCEELFFRGAVLNGLRKMGRWPAILLSALVFSLMHANIQQMAYTFLLGIILGYVVYETRCVWLAVGMHFLNNAIVLLIGFLANLGVIENTSAAVTGGYIGYAIISALIGVAFVVLMFWLISKFGKKPAPGAPTPLPAEAGNASVAVEARPQGNVAGKMLIFAIVVGVAFVVIDFLTNALS